MKPALIAAVLGGDWIVATPPATPVDVQTFVLYVLPGRDFVFVI